MNSLFYAAPSSFWTSLSTFASATILSFIYFVWHLLMLLASTWLTKIIWSCSSICCLNFLLKSSISTSDSLSVLSILLTWSRSAVPSHQEIQYLSNIDASSYGDLLLLLLTTDNKYWLFKFVVKTIFSSSIFMTTASMLLSQGTAVGGETFIVVSSSLFHAVFYRVFYKHLHSLEVCDN